MNNKQKNSLTNRAVTKSKGRYKNFQKNITNLEGLINEIDPFQFDIYQIEQTISFQRLAEKQNQLKLTLELALYSESLAKILGLNSKLSQAIALASNLGKGSNDIVLKDYIKRVHNSHFNSDIASLMVIKEIEKLNLSFETMEGIVYKDRQEEYMLVFFLQRFLNLVHGFKEKRPKELLYLGETKKEQLEALCKALIKESNQNQKITFKNSSQAQAFLFLEKWLKENIFFQSEKEKRYGVLWKKFYQVSKFLDKILEVEADKIPFILSLLTTNEMELLSSFDHKSSLKDIEEIKKLDFFKLLPYCPQTIITKKEFFW